MLKRRYAILLALLFAGVTVAVAAAPSEDAPSRMPVFYAWGGQVPAEPGRLLRREPLEAPLHLPGAAINDRVLYVSTDGVDGQAVTPVSGAVFIPRGAPPAGGWPVIAWAHGTTGMADICAPSVQGRSLRDIRYLAGWLQAGFAVVATDYQGLGTAGPHPYMNTRAEAFSVLDAIRAARSTYGAVLSNRTVLLGQSQGGQAAVAAAVYARDYAPEVDVRGAIATGAPYIAAGNGELSALGGDDGFTGGADATLYYRFYLLMMASAAQPGMDPAQALTAQGQELLPQAQGVCNNRLEADIRALGANRLTAFYPGALERALEPVASRMAYPHLKSKSPIFLGVGGRDEEVSPSAQLRLARDACAAGTVVEVHLYPEASHGQAVTASLRDSLPFAQRVISGQPVQPMCAPVSD